MKGIISSIFRSCDDRNSTKSTPKDFLSKRANISYSSESVRESFVTLDWWMSARESSGLRRYLSAGLSRNAETTASKIFEIYSTCFGYFFSHEDSSESRWEINVGVAGSFRCKKEDLMEEIIGGDGYLSLIYSDRNYQEFGSS